MKKFRKTACMLLAVIVMMAMSTTTASAASFNKKATKITKAKCVSGVSVQVTSKAKKGATGYKFYYATSKNGKYKVGATSTKRTATIKGLKAGKTYYFKVKAYKGKILKKYTKFSKPVKCKVVLKAPAVAYKDKCCCRIALKLSGSTGATGYKIYRSTSKTSGYEKVGTTSAKSWIDEGASGKESPALMPSTTYYYKVRAYKGSYHSPYSSVLTVKTLPLINGNDSKYNPAGSSALVPLQDGNDVLKGRKILFLGSSITYGSATGGVSFANYVAKRNETTVKKLAVSGTNMAKKTNTDYSYVNRLAKDNPASFIPDIFACQLSLNDSLNGIALGTLPDVGFNDWKDMTNEEIESEINDLYKGANTVGGAIGYITAYAKYHWPDSQVVFYTVRNNGYNNQYTKMRSMLYSAQKKYGNFEIIDMWKIPEITDLKKDLKTFCLYMNDNNHPHKAGYLYQWTPEFERAFINWMPAAPEYCTVTWQDENGNTLETDTNARKGEIPSYNGKTPTKAEDADYTYEFVGWRDASDPDPESFISEQELKEVRLTGNVTYIAVFNKTAKATEPAESEQPSDQEQPSQPEQPQQPGGTDGTGDDTNTNTDVSEPSAPAEGGSSDGQGGDNTSLLYWLYRAA